MVLDLRRQVLAAYVKPSDSKEKDFHLALSDYLYKELRKNNLKISKHNVLLKISLESKHQDKYEHIVIDCLEGKLYLRGSEVRDRYFGRLTKFSGGQRASDAYYCAIQSASKIIKRIQEIQDSLNGLKKEILGETNLIDMRQKKQTIAKDLRRTKVANIEIVRKDLRKVTKIECKDMRKIANIERRDLRKVVNVQRQDLRKTNHIQREDLRLIKKSNEYDWVKERAEHIQDKNPDMDEGESYGIAWIQYKKKHPKWKSKKEKEKKKSARLIKKAEYVHCHSCGWDNGDFMYNDDDTLQSWVPKPDTKKFKRLRKNQIYKNRKEFDEKNPNKICPICGEQDLDID